MGQSSGLVCGGPERDLPRPRLHRNLAIVLAVGQKQGQAALTCCSLSLRRHSWLYRELESRGPGVEVLPKANGAAGQTGQACARDTLRRLPPSRGLRREAKTWRGARGRGVGS